MPITPPIAESALTYTVEDLITDALIETGMLSPGETPDDAQGPWAFRKLNYLLDTWATSKKYVTAVTLLELLLNPNLPVQPDGSQLSTIGPAPGATYPVSQRPVKIVSANVIINNVSPPVKAHISVETDQWWMSNTLPGITSMYPTNLFYNPTSPNGSLYLWPVPTTAFGLELEVWQIISQFDSITDPIGGPGAAMTMPPGYRNAIMLSLAESLLPGGEREAHPTLITMAAQARAAIFTNNVPSANISTLDSGMPGNQEGRRSTTWSYRTRTWT